MAVPIVDLFYCGALVLYAAVFVQCDVLYSNGVVVFCYEMWFFAFCLTNEFLLGRFFQLSLLFIV